MEQKLRIAAAPRPLALQLVGDTAIQLAYTQNEDSQPKVFLGQNINLTGKAVTAINRSVPTGNTDITVPAFDQYSTPDYPAGLSRDGSTFYKSGTTTVLTSGYANDVQIGSEVFMLASPSGWNSLPSNITVIGDPLPATAAELNGLYVPIDNNTIEYREFTGIDLTNLSPPNQVTTLNVQGYYVVITADTVYWANPLNPTDFTPALGAGGSAKIQGQKGDTIGAVPIDNGAIIYAQHSVISMQFSGDTTSPWIFNVVEGAPASIRDFSMQDGQDTQFMLDSNNNLYQVTPNQITPVLEDVTDIMYALMKAAPKDQTPYTDYSTSVTGTSDIGVVNTAKFIFLHSANSTWGTMYAAIDKITGEMQFLPYKEADVRRIPMLPHPSCNRNTDWEYEQVAWGDDLMPVLYTTDLTIAEGYNTILTEVALVGSAVAANYNVDWETLYDTRYTWQFRTKVYAYSNQVLGEGNYEEFLWNPTTKTFQGWLEAPDLRLKIFGTFFNVTDIECSVQRGGKL